MRIPVVQRLVAHAVSGEHRRGIVLPHGLAGQTEFFPRSLPMKIPPMTGQDPPSHVAVDHLVRRDFVPVEAMRREPELETRKDPRQQSEKSEEFQIPRVELIANFRLPAAAADEWPAGHVVRFARKFTLNTAHTRCDLVQRRKRKRRAIRPHDLSSELAGRRAGQRASKLIELLRRSENDETMKIINGHGLSPSWVRSQR